LLCCSSYSIPSYRAGPQHTISPVKNSGFRSPRAAAHVPRVLLRLYLPLCAGCFFGAYVWAAGPVAACSRRRGRTLFSLSYRAARCAPADALPGAVPPRCYTRACACAGVAGRRAGLHATITTTSMPSSPLPAITGTGRHGVSRVWFAHTCVRCSAVSALAATALPGGAGPPRHRILGSVPTIAVRGSDGGWFGAWFFSPGRGERAGNGG